MTMASPAPHAPGFITRIRDAFAANPALFTLLRKILELNFITQRRIIRRLLGPPAGKEVLDVGCGTGEFSPLFDAQRYHGIDISAAYIRHARRVHAGSFGVMDATHLAFSDAQFDFVLVMAILHHLSDQDVHAVLREVRRVAKRGGTILILEDAQVQEKETWLTKLAKRYDKGSFIRTPQQYRQLFGAEMLPREEFTFRNGVCVYYGAVFIKA